MLNPKLLKMKTAERTVFSAYLHCFLSLELPSTKANVDKEITNKTSIMPDDISGIAAGRVTCTGLEVTVTGCDALSVT